MKLTFYNKWIYLLVVNLIAVLSYAQILTQPGNVSICFGFNSNLVISSNSSDFYKWQDSSSSGWQNLSNGGLFSGVTNDTILITNANLTINGKRLRCIVDSANAGTRFDTSSTSIITVFQAINKPILSSNQTICYNASPDTLVHSQNATGANGNFTYQWQFSSNGLAWTSIVGQTGLKYKPPSLNSNRFYRTVATSVFGCGTVNSDPLLITVRDSINAGVISNSQLICYNTSPNNISFTTAASGAGGNYALQWQTSNDSLTFTDILANNLTIYNPGVSIVTKFYRVKVTSNLGCGVQFTNRIKILVYPPYLKALIGNSKQICFNAVSDTIKVNVFPTGGNGIYSYQWLNSNDSLIWSDLIGQSQSFYFPSKLTVTKYYKLISSSGASCGVDTSNTIKISVFSDKTKPLISSSQTICYNTSPDSLIRIGSATGANGSFTYSWQSALDGLNWLIIPGQISLKYKPQNSTSTTFYRILANSTFGCGSIASDSVRILVFDSLNQGNIGSNQNICFNSIPVRLTFSQLPRGAGDSYNYNWQISTDSLNFTNIVNSDSNGHQPLNLNITKYYRSVITSSFGCGTKNTDIVKIKVYGLFKSASIMHSNTSPICYLTNSDTLKIGNLPIGGNLNYTYQWLESDDSLTWSLLPSQNQQFYKSPILISSKYYRLISSSGESCGSDSSNSLKVNVLPNIQKPTIGSNQSICYSATADSLRLNSQASGANEEFSYNWQISINGNSWNSIFNDTNSTLSTGTLIASKYYRILATSTYGCGSIPSDSVFIKVYPAFIPGVINANQNICYNNNASNLLLSTLPFGGGGLYSYLWQKSIDSLSFTNLIVDTFNTINPGALLATSFYRLQVHSKFGCGQLPTNIIKIKVYNPFVPSSILSNQQICFDAFPDTFKVDRLPIGGNETYSYRWNSSVDSTNWIIIPGETKTFYFVGRMRSAGFYRLESISGQLCGAGYSNIVKLTINPLPDSAIVLGKGNVCKNTKDEIYELSKSSNQYLYNWQLIGGKVISGANLPKAYINWFDSERNDTIWVNQINKITGCYNTMFKPVSILNSRAPDKTNIIRKPNSNILVCEVANEVLNYQWGYTLKSMGIDSLLSNGNLQYVQLNHNFDSVSYKYWVETSQNSCLTRSFLGASPIPTAIDNGFYENKVIKVYPNPILENKLTIETFGKEISNMKVFDVTGKLYEFDFMGKELEIFNCPSSLIILQFEVENVLVTKRLININ
jgi:hypothetical protein